MPEADRFDATHLMGQKKPVYLSPLRGVAEEVVKPALTPNQARQAQALTSESYLPTCRWQFNLNQRPGLVITEPRS